MTDLDGDEQATLQCAVVGCEKPAFVEVYPTNGETEHSALRCRSCLDEDTDREWFREWAHKIRGREEVA